MLTACQRIEEAVRSSSSKKLKVGLDTNCVRYYLSDPPIQPWADCLDPIFQAGLNGQADLYVSTVVVSELLAHAHFASRDRVGYDPELDLLAIINRHFQILDVDYEVAKAAGRLRGSYLPGDRITLKTPDALIGATSLARSHALFVTNDAQLANALPPSNCIYLGEMAIEWLEANFPGNCIANTGPVLPRRRGIGLSGGAFLASQELGSIKPDPSAKWDRILADAFTAAAMVNEPCLFLVLVSSNGRKTETKEIVFWHEGLNQTRSRAIILKQLREHLGYDPRSGMISNAHNHIYVFYFVSISRERARQSKAEYSSKSEHEREYDAWNDYLRPVWYFRDLLSLPNVTYLLCEDGTARQLDSRHTYTLLTQARNVLGWND